MFKFICAIIICGSIGFGSYSYYQANKEHHLGIGQTKSGQACRIVEKWDDGNTDTLYRQQGIEEFLRRNTPNSRPFMQNEVRYDCFLNIDTEEYKLTAFDKTEDLSGYSEKYTFNNRDKSADCETFQYRVNCRYTDVRKSLYCTASGTCIRKNEKSVFENNHIVIVVAVGILYIFVFIDFIIRFVPAQ